MSFLDEVEASCVKCMHVIERNVLSGRRDTGTLKESSKADISSSRAQSGQLRNELHFSNVDLGSLRIILSTRSSRSAGISFCPKSWELSTPAVSRLRQAS